MKTKYKLAFAAILTTGLLLAQADKPAAPAAEPEYFHLDFVVKEVEHGKVVNSRNYSTIMLAGGKDRASIRTSTKMPIPTGPPTGFPDTRQLQYVNAGVDIDCTSIQRQRDRLTMYVTADVSTVVPAQDEKGTPKSPQIRQNRWNSFVIVPVGKPTMLFSSDDLASTRTLQIEVTAIPVK